MPKIFYYGKHRLDEHEAKKIKLNAKKKKKPLTLTLLNRRVEMSLMQCIVNGCKSGNLRNDKFTMIMHMPGSTFAAKFS
jgi:hypothetical protein